VALTLLDKRVGGAGGRASHSGDCLLVVFTAVCPPVLMGYDPDDKTKLGEDAEGCGSDVSPITGGQRALGGRAGKIIAIATVDTALYGMKIGLAVWLGFVTTAELTNALFIKQPTTL